MRRWRPRLSTRITIAVVAVAVGVAATTAGALVWNARSIILESKQEAIYDVLRFEARAAAEELSARPGQAELNRAAEEFSVPTVLVNLRTGVSGGTVPLEFVPQYLLEGVAANEGATAFERSSRYRSLEFLAGLSLRAGITPTGDPIAVFGVYDMQSQQEEIDALVRLGVTLGIGFVIAAAGIGLIVGRQLGRPLHDLVSAAEGLGERARPPAGDTVYPDVNAVLDAMRGSAERLDTSIARLEHSEANARRLVADVAHELRTPLATLVAVSDILADTEAATPEDRAAAGSIAARSAGHLAGLTNDILEMSRFDAGHSEVVTGPVDVQAVWDELAELRDWSSVTFELSGERVVTTDVVRLNLMLANLVTNALRHGEPPVRVSAWHDRGRLTVVVADGGVGLGEADRERVFARFYKASSSRTGSESSGLGLSIVRENARVLGGDAWLVDGETTQFAFWVPVG